MGSRGLRISKRMIPHEIVSLNAGKSEVGWILVVGLGIGRATHEAPK